VAITNAGSIYMYVPNQLFLFVVLIKLIYVMSITSNYIWCNRS